MGEADIRFLKTKCNKLIDKALQLEQELHDKDSIIKQLQENKKALENSIQEQKEKVLQEKQLKEYQNIQQSVPENITNFELKEEKTISEDIVNEDAPNYMVTYEKVFEMIQAITTQMDNRPMEEIIVRKITFGGKILELITDGIGKILKFILLGGLMILLSLAVTVLLNEDLRNTLITFVKNCVG